MPKVRRLLPIIAAMLCCLAFLGGCSSDKTANDAYKERAVEDLYNEAMDALNNEDYDKAAKSFDEVERQHPYSVWATKAQLMAAFSHYEHNKFDDAIVALDRFIQLHPSHKDVAYAYYLKALCYYEQIADVARDQKNTDLAMKTLQEIIDRFPHSRYARDAKLKIDLTRDHLAGKEMTIGRYYERQEQYLAAINRYRIVIDKYQTTTHVPEALQRLSECYEALGLHDQAVRTASVLGFNYPGNQWYSQAYGLVQGNAPERPAQGMGLEKPAPKSGGSWFSWPW